MADGSLNDVETIPHTCAISDKTFRLVLFRRGIDQSRSAFANRCTSLPGQAAEDTGFHRGISENQSLLRRLERWGILQNLYNLRGQMPVKLCRKVRETKKAAAVLFCVYRGGPSRVRTNLQPDQSANMAFKFLTTLFCLLVLLTGAAAQPSPAAAAREYRQAMNTRSSANTSDCCRCRMSLPICRTSGAMPN